MRRTLITLALAGTLTLAGCDDAGRAATDPETPRATGSSSESSSQPAGTTVDIMITGDRIVPNGDRVPAVAGEPVTLDITADRAGELHVHSSPEQQIAYEQGTTTAQVTVDRPGVVDVEDHEAGLIVIQLEVS